jgi:hypothetical protein
MQTGHPDQEAHQGRTSATGTPSTLLTPPLSAATSSAAPTRAGIALISLDMSVLCLALPQIGRELEAD